LEGRNGRHGFGIDWQHQFRLGCGQNPQAQAQVGPKTPTLGLTNADLHVLENPQVLAGTNILLGLDDEIKFMTQAMNRVQQSLPVYLKLRGVISDNAKLEERL